MIRIAPFAVVATLAACGVWWVMSLQADKEAQAHEIAALSRSLAAMEQQAANAALARDVEAARAAGAAEREAEARAVIDQIENADLGECADVEISDTLRDILGGL